MLDINIERTKEEIRISQRAYVKKMLKKFNMANCKPRSISLLVRTSLLTNNLLIDKKKDIRTINMTTSKYLI